MEKMLLTYGIPKETADAIMMLYKNAKAMDHTSNGDYYISTTSIL